MSKKDLFITVLASGALVISLLSLAVSYQYRLEPQRGRADYSSFGSEISSLYSRCATLLNNKNATIDAINNVSDITGGNAPETAQAWYEQASKEYEDAGCYNLEH